nr:MAG TPA: hypothetical protein [Caudoviricetes sp.]
MPVSLLLLSREYVNPLYNLKTPLVSGKVFTDSY